MKPILLFSFLLCLLLTGSRCKSPTEPEKPTGSDTTSHNFIWQVDTIGYRNTTLNDGVIINENDIWVVGEIYPDSASYKNGIAYGVAHWDGSNWTTKRVPVKSSWSSDYIINLQPQSICPLNDKEFMLGGAHIYDGEKVTKSFWLINYEGNPDPNPVFEIGQRPTKLFKTSAGEVYCYGSRGALGYFTGSSWVKIPTNTDLDIVDMHGDYNPKTGEYELLALASRSLQKEGNLLLKVSNQTAVPILAMGLDDYSKDMLWFHQGGDYWIVGAGSFYKKSITDSLWKKREDYPSSNWYVADVNGTDSSNLFMTLHDGHLLHYNGSTWKDFKNDLNLSGLAVGKIIIQNDLVIIIGREFSANSRGIIIRGKHIN